MRRGEIARYARWAQLALLGGALFSAVAWAESDAGREAIGSESVDLTYEAPVAHPRGPWKAGDVLTPASAGVHVDVAPVWNIAATHAFSAGTAGAHAWSATLTMRSLAGDGRTWWQITEPVDLHEEGARATGQINVSAVLDRVEELQAEAAVPGAPDILLTVTHAARLNVDGKSYRPERTATLSISPNGRTVGTAIAPFVEQLSHPLAKPLPWTAIGLVGAALALEVVARAAGRDVRAWEQARGVHVVEVQDLIPPVDAAQTSQEDLLAAARRTGGVVLLDAKKNVMLLTGDVKLIAHLEGITDAHVEDVESSIGPRRETREPPLDHR